VKVRRRRGVLGEVAVLGEAAMPEDVETLLTALRERHAQLQPAPQHLQPFVAHLKSLGRGQLDAAIPTDPGPVEFPDRIHVTFAVCPCGVREFIVDGSTQECQGCGSLMFRTETAEYARIKVQSTE
jgi:hypothetical protein